MFIPGEGLVMAVRSRPGVRIVSDCYWPEADAENVSPTVRLRPPFGKIPPNSRYLSASIYVEFNNALILKHTDKKWFQSGMSEDDVMLSG